MIGESPFQTAVPAVRDLAASPIASAPPIAAQAELGGRDGPEPTRYGDWEKNGRCIDF